MALARVADRAAYALNGEMEHLAAILKSFSDPSHIEDRAHYNVYIAIRRRIGQILWLAGREIIEYSNLPSCTHEVIDQVTTDEPSTARYQNSIAHRALFRKL